MALTLHSLAWIDERGVKVTLHPTIAEREDWLREHLLARCEGRRDAQKFEDIDDSGMLASALFEAGLMDGAQWAIETHSIDLPRDHVDQPDMQF
jgi:hypothetical protein